MALEVGLTYPWHPTWLLVLPGSAPALDLRWVEGLGCSPPPLLLPLPVPRVLSRDLPQRTSPPLCLEKLHAFWPMRALRLGTPPLGPPSGVAVATGVPAFGMFCPAGYPA